MNVLSGEPPSSVVDTDVIKCALLGEVLSFLGVLLDLFLIESPVALSLIRRDRCS